ncbi:CHAP domain-containing protein [Paenarthrobacter sp. Z7-10]|uniref:CHAP domain-containing protein n=1 Tax=Paenarthrobacter sp. Z7-10 TaxID=2787635 RepID=UPI0022A94049|nr:CHAP domain-containing protein [Paenarthrobacter sp. Z7-10]MCZ2404384.1 CHAP domain-containing protein [Paenarthrobacter sp. Z7-10]
MNKGSIGAVVVSGAFFVPIALLLSIVVLLGSGSPSLAGGCEGPAVSVDYSKLPGNVAGYVGERLKNAAAIMGAAKSLNLPKGAQVLGVQAALGESSLDVNAPGDAAGPDSAGLFAQRGNGAWGSYADRMNPTVSATNFFKALQGVQGWESLDPSVAIHRVQGNADPYHYAKFARPAIQIVTALSGAKLTNGSCAPNTGVTTSQAGNDYPWKTSPVGTNNPATHFNFRECVDFAWYRFMQQVGTPDPPYKYDSLAIRPGSASTWKAAWDRQGWATGAKPVVGAIAWFAPYLDFADIKTGEFGHVGVVKAVNPDGSVQVEQYNGRAAPNDHQYSVSTLPADHVSAYLYIPK